jgi:hypothetical protein
MKSLLIQQNQNLNGVTGFYNIQFTCDIRRPQGLLHLEIFKSLMEKL